MDQLDQDALRAILESAIQAPSADNLHKIRFQLIAGSTLHIHYTEAKLPPQGSYKRVLALLSLGAVSVNITVAASRFGLQAATVLFPEPTKPDWVMRIHMQPNQVEADPLFPAIALRHTNRQVRFRGPGMTDAELRELDAAVSAYPNCQLVWMDEPIQRRLALRLMRRAETERFHNAALHEELFSAIRFEAGWHTSCPEGLPPGALGVEPPLRPFFALLRHWPIMRVGNLLGAHHLMGWRACDLPCRLAPHLGLLAVRNTDDQSIFDTGRAFQRLWLVVTNQGRVLQPMPASALFALEGVEQDGIPVGLQHDLEQAWKANLQGAVPLMLFRMGIAKPSSIVAGRLGIENYMVEKKA